MNTPSFSLLDTRPDKTIDAGIMDIAEKFRVPASFVKIRLYREVQAEYDRADVEKYFRRAKKRISQKKIALIAADMRNNYDPDENLNTNILRAAERLGVL